jgi:prepilin-type N-terminal cleavage/methylation domain-containing protein
VSSIQTRSAHRTALASLLCCVPAHGVNRVFNLDDSCLAPHNRSSPDQPQRRWDHACNAGFTLLEVVVATAVVVVGFLGMFATVLQGGKMVSGAEEDALVARGLEQRIDQLRLLEWDELTDGTGVLTKVWTARPEAMAGIAVSQETLTISPCDVPGTQTLQATWNGTSSPTKTFTAGTSLSGASAVKVVATLTWTGRRSKQARTGSLVTVISRGGISKSDRP